MSRGVTVNGESEFMSTDLLGHPDTGRPGPNMRRDGSSRLPMARACRRVTPRQGAERTNRRPIGKIRQQLMNPATPTELEAHDPGRQITGNDPGLVDVDGCAVATSEHQVSDLLQIQIVGPHQGLGIDGLKDVSGGERPVKGRKRRGGRPRGRRAQHASAGRQLPRRGLAPMDLVMELAQDDRMDVRDLAHDRGPHPAAETRCGSGNRSRQCRRCGSSTPVSRGPSNATGSAVRKQ